MKTTTTILFPFFALCVLLSSFKKDKPKQRLTPRTDGYYEYDNHVDTIMFAADSKELMGYIDLELDKLGIRSKKKSRCVPEGLIVEDGSSLIDYLAFFTDTSGTSTSSICRDDSSKIEAIQRIFNIKNGYDTTEFAQLTPHINRVQYTDGDYISFYTEYGEPSPYYYGKIYRDSLVLKTFITGNEISKGRPDAHRVYHFVPYSKER